MERQILCAQRGKFLIRSDISCDMHIEARRACRAGNCESVRKKKPGDVYVQEHAPWRGSSAVWWTGEADDSPLQASVGRRERVIVAFNSV